jgi:hypothetical protein
MRQLAMPNRIGSVLDLTKPSGELIAWVTQRKPLKAIQNKNNFLFKNT